jgi:hypothetical protein
MQVSYKYELPKLEKMVVPHGSSLLLSGGSQNT